MSLRAVLAGAVALSFLLGCGRRALDASDPNVIAKVGDTRIPREAFERYVSQTLSEQGTLLSSEALSALLDQFLDEQVLLRLAQEQGLVEKEAPASRALDRLLEAQGVRKIPPEAALRAHYERDPVRYRFPEQVELEQVLVDDRRSGELARRWFEAGKGLEEIEKQLGSSARLVDRTVQSVAELPRAISEAVFALKPGEASRVLSTDSGFLVFRLVRRLPERQLSFEEARERVVADLLEDSANRTVEALLQEGRSRYAVRVLERNLSFAYRGNYPKEEDRGER